MILNGGRFIQTRRVHNLEFVVRKLRCELIAENFKIIWTFIARAQDDVMYLYSMLSSRMDAIDGRHRPLAFLEFPAPLPAPGLNPGVSVVVAIGNESR